ncbi:porin family protein [Maribacter sp. 2308TA10-17]|uniref:porin family protein n=1 Tax=Maribacter sp. 2308TA10-17 TaxID=3386276 RepID=UPI0039BD9147
MKRFFLLLFFSTITIQLHSQDFSFGAKAGLNLSTVTGDVPESINPRLAYHLGGFVNIPLSERFSLHPELLYFSIGSTFSLSTNEFTNFDPDPFSGSGSFRSVNRANFLAVPVNFRFNFTDRFGLDFGPQISFLLNTASKVKENPDNLDAFNQTTPGRFVPDYGANLGLTFSPIDKFNFQLRYYQGLKNLSFFREDRSFNVALQFSVGYVIF